MAERPNTIAGLLDKRREIAGEVQYTETRLRQLIIDLDNLDATIRLFDPDIELEIIKPKPFPPRNAAVQGELTRLVLDTLRQAEGPLTSHYLAQHVMAARGMNTADTRLVKLMRKRVGACLRANRAKGRLRAQQGPKQHLMWEIAE